MSSTPPQPAPGSTQAASIEADARYLRSLSALCVEDDPEACALMAEFISRRVRQVHTATDGREGLRLFREQRPDLVVTDIRMPEMDGLALVGEIRRIAPTVPVIVATAFEQPGYLVRSIDLGVDKYIVKPVQLARLEAALLSCAHRLRGEEELRRRGELEAAVRRHQTVGLLAGGMAHDYNNLLQAILGNVCLARAIAPAGGEIDELLAAAETSAKRAGDLGQLLVLVASGGLFRAAPVPIADLLAEAMGPVVEGTRVALHFDLEEGPLADGEVLGDGRQLLVLFAQLADNAVAAMPSGGVLRVRLAPVHVAASVDGFEPSVAHELPLPAGDYLDVAVSDTGPGIPPAIQRTLFEPYVTTKERGAARGTGLGLTMCRSIAQRHGGLITVDPPGARGASFHVYLPRA